jgi:hypothetical protein
MTTVKIMILFRYHYRTVTVFGPPLPFFVTSYTPLLTVPDYCSPLPLLTVRSVYIINLILFYNAVFNNTAGSPILSTTPYRTVPYRTVPHRTVPYRTVPYRFPLQLLSRSRSLSARRTVFFA